MKDITIKSMTIDDQVFDRSAAQDLLIACGGSVEKMRQHIEMEMTAPNQTLEVIVTYPIQMKGESL